MKDTGLFLQLGNGFMGIGDFFLRIKIRHRSLLFKEVLK